MTHDQIKELLAAYALDALDPDENAIVKSHLAEGCSSCQQQLAEFESVSGLIGLTAEPVAPPRQTRAALLAAIASEDEKHHEAIHYLPAGQGNWETIFPGITMRQLSVNANTGYTVALIRMAAGSILPRHRHLGPEEVFVLEGDGINGDLSFSAGDFSSAPAGSIHEATTTANGCLMLAVLPQVEFF